MQFPWVGWRMCIGELCIIHDLMGGKNLVLTKMMPGYSVEVDPFEGDCLPMVRLL